MSSPLSSPDISHGTENKTGVTHPERDTLVLSSISDYNRRASEIGLDLEPGTPDYIHFVPQNKISEMRNGGDVAAATSPETLDIFISDDDYAPAELYDILVHELGHRGRCRRRLDFRYTHGHQEIEEGIIQSNAQFIERENQKVSDRTKFIYQFEAQMATSLAEALGVSTLMGQDHVWIRRRMQDVYPHLNQTPEWGPYDLLTEDIQRFNHLYLELARELTDDSTTEQVQEKKNQIMQLRQQIFKFWNFVDKAT